jgi:excisionase family DNA binding protein
VSGAQDSPRLLLTTARVAALLEITHCSAVRLCSTGKLDYVRVGKQYRIGEEAARAYQAGG